MTGQEASRHNAPGSAAADTSGSRGPHGAREPDAVPGPPPFVAVEGGSGVGKSVTSRALAARLGTLCFPEYFDYVYRVGGETLPAFPPRDDAAVAAENRLWPVMELRRQAHRCRDRPPAPGLPQVVDTSPLSVLGFEIAKAAFGLPAPVQELAADYLDLYRSGRLQEPAAWVFLSADPEIVLARIAARGGSRPFLKRVDVIRAVDEVRRAFTELLPAGSYVWIDNTRIPVDTVVDRTCAFLDDGFCAAAGSSPLRRFLERLVQDPAPFIDQPRGVTPVASETAGSTPPMVGQVLLAATPGLASPGVR